MGFGVQLIKAVVKWKGADRVASKMTKGTVYEPLSHMLVRLPEKKEGGYMMG